MARHCLNAWARILFSATYKYTKLKVSLISFHLIVLQILPEPGHFVFFFLQNILTKLLSTGLTPETFCQNALASISSIAMHTLLQCKRMHSFVLSYWSFPFLSFSCGANAQSAAPVNPLSLGAASDKRHALAAKDESEENSSDEVSI